MIEVLIVRLSVYLICFALFVSFIIENSEYKPFCSNLSRLPLVENKYFNFGNMTVEDIKKHYYYYLNSLMQKQTFSILMSVCQE